MDLDQLKQLISSAAWFSRLGEPIGESGHVSIPSLAPWSSTESSDPEVDRIADQMTWLPGSRDEDDPIHGSMLEDQAEAAGERGKFTKVVLEVYKAAMVALRDSHDHPALHLGPHDFSGAARGAALFATRRATLETLLDESGFWCEVMEIYAAGHWPCGLLPDRRLVIL